MRSNYVTTLGKISGMETLNEIRTTLNHSRIGNKSFLYYLIMYLIRFSAFLIPAFISIRILGYLNINSLWNILKLAFCVFLIRFIYLKIIQLLIVFVTKNKKQ